MGSTAQRGHLLTSRGQQAQQTEHMPPPQNKADLPARPTGQTPPCWLHFWEAVPLQARCP
jgi:hypothetical protein